MYFVLNTLLYVYQVLQEEQHVWSFPSSRPFGMQNYIKHCASGKQVAKPDEMIILFSLFLLWDVI